MSDCGATRLASRKDLPKPIREEIEKFFVATDELESKELKFLGRKGPKAALRLIEAAAKNFKNEIGMPWWPCLRERPGGERVSNLCFEKR